ncbi:hypothetical protein [Pseudomonas sp. PWP3-1b2]|uniref:hypothetical protein n=1 Tax=Pseudomonas sp. PWP3-1b2 TaxID=2804656 RepID=UPI003CF5109D
MIPLPQANPPKSTLDGLAIYQAQVNAIPSYADRVTAAKSKFKSYNVAKNSVFKAIRGLLAQMCAGPRRCCYCEDSVADEVEHIAPKNLYPDLVFDWANYLYACGACNGPKSSKYAIISKAGLLVHVGRGKNDPVILPASGIHALINPRAEDPQEYLWLDIIDTFNFVAIAAPGTVKEVRATYTCELLALNNRDVLVEARRVAFGSYRARLVEYITARDDGASILELNSLIVALNAMANPAVWLEMKRSHLLRPDLQRLFGLAPEAHNW